jgi:zinc finger protein
MGPESTETTCFVCNKGNLVLSTSVMKIPSFGEVAITTFVCDHCGYRSTDIIPVETRPPRRYTCLINGGETLSIRVIRSSTGTVMIPEIGVRIDPGTASEGYITNVEGILNRIEGIVDHLLKDSYRSINVEEKVQVHGNISRCMMIKDMIMATKNGTMEMSLIIEDPYGNSALVSDSVPIRQESLTEDDILSLIEGIRVRKD